MAGQFHRASRTTCVPTGFSFTNSQDRHDAVRRTSQPERLLGRVSGSQAILGRFPGATDWLPMPNGPTHTGLQCLSACAYLGSVLCGLIHGIDRDLVLAPNGLTLLHLKKLHALHPEIAEVAEGSFWR